MDNYVEYHNKTAAHNIALSAANIVANEVYRMPTQGANNSGWQDFQGGKMQWSISGWINKITFYCDWYIWKWYKCGYKHNSNTGHPK